MQNVRGKISHVQRAVTDTFYSVKDVFEKHNVVFTIGASLASAGAAWAGYTARQSHQRKVEDRLNSLEHVMTTVHHMEEEQVKALTQQVGVSYKACAATAGTTLVIGVHWREEEFEEYAFIQLCIALDIEVQYGLGFRGGRWYAVKRYQRQQQKLVQASASPTTSLLKKLPDTLRIVASKKPETKTQRKTSAESND